MINDKMLQSKFVTDWKRQNKDIIRMRYPDMSGKEIEKFLNTILEQRLESPKVIMYNNFKNQIINTDAISLIDWIDNVKPIMTESGVLFKSHDKAPNPNAKMLLEFADFRKKYKRMMYSYDPESYEFSYYDRKQNEEKVNMNAFYGASGNVSFIFYNLHSATSVTMKGQSLISTAILAFENFLTNNVKFMSFDEILVYIRNITTEKRSSKRVSDMIGVVVDIDKVINLLIEKSMFTLTNGELNHLRYIISELDLESLTRVYYKNNIYKFSSIPMISDMIENIMKTLKDNNVVFNDPNEIPECLKEDITEMWSYYSEFVHYNYLINDNIYRVKNHVRKTVVVIDTDSAMIVVDPWYKFVKNKILKDKHNTSDDVRYNAINLIATICGNMIGETLINYCKSTNVPKEMWKEISMKNEYLFKRLMTTSNKKNYAAVMELKEGKPMNGKLEIKGLPIMKTGLMASTRKALKGILEDDIMRADTISVGRTVKHLLSFEDQIRISLSNGEKKYCKPASVDELGAYANIYSMPPIKGSLVWNAIYPEREIRFPVKVDLIKVTLDDPKSLAKLADAHPDIYEKLQKEIFSIMVKKNIQDKKSGIITEKMMPAFDGINVIALPKDCREIPEWIRPYIDVETIVTDNTSSFGRILESIGGTEISATGYNSSYSNIIEI